MSWSYIPIIIIYSLILLCPVSLIQIIDCLFCTFTNAVNRLALLLLLARARLDLDLPSLLPDCMIVNSLAFRLDLELATFRVSDP